MAGTALRIRLIGAVSVVRQSEVVEVRGPRQRAVLAVLALRAGQVVPRDALVRAVWGEAAPPSSVGNLHTYVSGLRRVLETDPRAPRVLRTVEHGYRLGVPSEHVDVLELDRLLAVARAASAADDPTTCLAALDAADELWRGSPLTGVDGPLAEQERRRLHHLRLACRELRAETLLDLGQPAQAAVEGAGLVAEYPLEERVVRLLSTSLFRSGRIDDALAELTAVRVRLREELGTQPSTRTLELYQQILESSSDRGAERRTGRPAEPAAVPEAPRRCGTVPRQLPHQPWGFTGRDGELAELARLVPGAGRPVVLSGYAGIGKTALATALAHRVADSFPDGQVYLNLGGSSSDKPMSPADVLDYHLHAFGVRPQNQPNGVKAKSVRLRSLLADRRALLLLDDAASVHQLRPLLGSSGASAILITSRSRLAELDTAARVTVSELPRRAAVELLCGHGNEPRAASAAELDRLAAMCGYVPLALRVASACMRRDSRGGPEPSAIRLLTDDLADEKGRLRMLSIDDDGGASILAGLEQSHGSLSAAAGELLARLSLLPEAELETGSSRAAALGEPVTSRCAAAAELIESGLLEATVGDRFRLPALVRLYAAHHAPPTPHRR